MGKSINVQKLNEEIILTVQDASFLDPVQTALYFGSRAEALIFAIKNNLEDEDYAIVPAKSFTNDPDDAVALTEILPSGGEGEITAEELGLIAKVTDSYRVGWTEQALLTVQDSAVATTRELYAGDRQSILVYLLTTLLPGSEKWAVSVYNANQLYGTTLTKLLSTTGPNLVTQAQVDLVRIFVM